MAELEKKDLQLVTFDTANDVSKLVTKSIDSFTKVFPKYEKILEASLGVLLKQDEDGNLIEFDNMDQETIIKLLATTSKLALDPIDKLTKLVQTLSQLQDKFDGNNNISKLQSIVEEFNKAKAPTSDDDSVIDADIVDADIE